MPRFESLSFRISSICFSWKSACADSVTTASFSSNFAPVPLKSKRWSTSRLAWSTALVTSCWLISETMSKEGMASYKVASGFRVAV